MNFGPTTYGRKSTPKDVSWGPFVLSIAGSVLAGDWRPSFVPDLEPISVTLRLNPRASSSLLHQSWRADAINNGPAQIKVNESEGRTVQVGRP